MSVKLNMKPEVLAMAVDLAIKQGYRNVTRQQIADRARISVGTVSNYFGTMANLHRAIMSFAVSRHVLSIVAQGLADGNSKAHAASVEVKRAALDSLL